MTKPIKELLDKDWLSRSYTSKTTAEIAAELGCSQSAVAGALKRHEIMGRSAGRPTPEQLRDRDWLEAEYSKYTSYEIGKSLGCAQTTVSLWVQKHNIPIRGRGRLSEAERNKLAFKKKSVYHPPRANHWYEWDFGRVSRDRNDDERW